MLLVDQKESPVSPAAKPAKKPRIAFLWATKNPGLYSNHDFDTLYKGIGHNNGNLAFVYAATSHLGEKITYYPWHVHEETLKKSADIIVIPCANQLGGHTDLGTMATKLRNVGLPVVAIGLGAQAASYDKDIEVTPGTLDWAKVISELSISSAPNIYTRGAYTSSQLDKLGITGSLPGGCPSFFISHDTKLGETIHKNWTSKPLPRSISVAGGHQAWAKTTRVEHQLISLMMDPLCPGQYVVQSMGDMIKISRGDFDSIDAKVLDRIHNYTVPHYSADEFRAWCRNYARSFYDVPAWMDTLRNHDLAIGSRYHGIALALQAGRMGLTVTIDSRTRELCENTGVPNISVEELTEPLTRQYLKKLVKFDPVEYDKKRATDAAKYVAFLESNSLTPADFLKRIADQA